MAPFLDLLNGFNARDALPIIGYVMQAAAVLIGLSYAWSWVRRDLLKAPPGPAFVLPLIGETITYGRSPCKYMWERWISYGGVFKTHLLGEPVFVPLNYPTVKYVWGNDDDFMFYLPGTNIKAILTSTRHMQEPEQHTYWRRKVLQSLGPGAIAAFLWPDVTRVMTRHLDAWERQGRVELCSACASLSLDLALEALTGHPLPPGVDAVRLRRLYQTIIAGLYSLPVNLPGTPLHRALRARRELEVLLGPVVESEIRPVEDKLREEAEAATNGAAPGKDRDKDEPRRFMEMQIAGTLPYIPCMSPGELADRTIGSVIGAGDTTRHLLFSCVLCVALAPEVKAKLEEEQLQAMREHGDALPYAVISNMPYLDAVVKETARLIPSANGGFRQAKRDVVLESVRVPRGSLIFYSVHALHLTDPALLPRGAKALVVAAAAAPGGGGGERQDDAAARRERQKLARGITGTSGLPTHMDYVGRFDEAFKPERWLSEETRPKQFANFGGGAHLCAGIHAVQAEAKLLLALLLRRFDFRLEDPRVLAKCAMFPGPRPQRGTDGLVLLPRRLEP